jgi:hypothetical protein
LETLAQAQRYAFIETRALAPDLRLRARNTDHWEALLRTI